MNKVRWGIMSTADIGATKVIPAMQNGTHCDIQAPASLSLEKAKAVATKLAIPNIFGSYEELLNRNPF
jgi:predicted dehydrogenase